MIQLANDYADFPTPVVELASGRVWKKTDVEKWLVKHRDRKPGRPTKR